MGLIELHLDEVDLVRANQFNDYRPNLIMIWYDVKLIAVVWLVLPQFRGVAFIYNKFVKEKVIKRYYPRIRGGEHKSSSSPPNGKKKNKLVDLMTTKESS
ncbi:unnamed protein product [Lactuca saligna]|uniref:HVA22-like protein n=1 Tax=Lactuca saligna TaxID=75948 RepID=A0AA35V3F3_LACSI|nr:unnamed protein product [Lactuca saligna]